MNSHLSTSCWPIMQLATSSEHLDLVSLFHSLCLILMSFTRLDWKCLRTVFLKLSQVWTQNAVRRDVELVSGQSQSEVTAQSVAWCYHHHVLLQSCLEFCPEGSVFVLPQFSPISVEDFWSSVRVAVVFLVISVAEDLFLSGSCTSRLDLCPDMLCELWSQLCIFLTNVQSRLPHVDSTGSGCIPMVIKANTATPKSINNFVNRRIY